MRDDSDSSEDLSKEPSDHRAKMNGHGSKANLHMPYPPKTSTRKRVELDGHLHRDAIFRHVVDTSSDEENWPAAAAGKRLAVRIPVSTYMNAPTIVANTDMRPHVKRLKAQLLSSDEEGDDEQVHVTLAAGWSFVG